MTESAAIAGANAVLQRCTLNNGTNYTSIGELKNISFSFKGNQGETTTLTSTDNMQEYITTTKSFTLSGSLNLIAADTQHAAVIAAAFAGTKGFFKYILPSGRTYTFKGNFSDVSISSNPGDPLEFSITIQGSGTIAVSG